MKIAAFVTTVNNNNKYEYLESVVSSIDKYDDLFDQKIITIDKITDHDIPSSLIKKYTELGWTILRTNNFGRWRTLHDMSKFFVSQSADFILHAEDDIMINWLPNKSLLSSFLSFSKNNKLCGQLTLSLGGSTFKCEGGDSGDFDYIQQELIFENNEVLVFKRKEEMASSFFFELGTMFVRPHILYDCLAHAHINYSGMQIEMAQTKSWFDLGIHNSYYRATLCKPLLKDVYKNEPLRADNECRFITILDPAQGSSLYGGNHAV